MSSRPRTFVLLIGAARAVPYPITSNPTDTTEYNLAIPAAHGDAAGYFRLVALAPSSTADAANMVTPVDVSTSAVLTDMITPFDDSSFATTHYELTEITPVPVSESTSSSRTFVTIGSVAPPSTAEAQVPPNIITITDWVTMTLQEPAPNDTGPVTVPIPLGRFIVAIWQVEDMRCLGAFLVDLRLLILSRKRPSQKIRAARACEGPSGKPAFAKEAQVASCASTKRKLEHFS